MTNFHQGIDSARWAKFSLNEQLANVGAEIGRAINWRKKGNGEQSQAAFWRGLDLLDLTIEVQHGLFRRRELLRLREVLVDYFAGKNEYHSTDESFNKYFYFFNAAASAART